MSEAITTTMLLSTAQVTRLLGIGRQTLSRWVRDGEFPAPAIGGGSGRTKRWRREDIERWLARKGGDHAD